MARASGGEAVDHMVKLLLIGAESVGKSSILLRFTDDTFDESQPATIGVDFKVRTVTLDGKRIKATLWDTAGQERFRTLTSSFYRGAQGILLVYDITRSDSFDSLEQWLAEVEHFCPEGGKNVAKLLVGNKADLDGSRQVDFSDGEAWARSQGMMFMETSAKTSKHIKEAFDEVLERILESPAMSAGTGPPKAAAAEDPAVDIADGGAASAAPSGCCG